MTRATVKTVAILLIAAVLIPFQTGAYAASLSAPGPAISAPSAILINEDTGETLWEKNPDQRRPMASTTKIMTALLAVEREELEDTVTTGESVIPTTRYGIKLEVGEQLTLEDLLYALLLYSANDAAMAIADHIGGSMNQFIKLMNTKALRLGATNTRFANPHGLPDENHYSTARDLAVITKYAMRNEDFSRIVSTKTWVLNRADPKKVTRLENRNRLLWSFAGTTGVKTGHTNEAGYCLVSSAETDTVSLIAVVLGAPSQKAVFNDSTALLTYGFSLYEKRKIVTKGKRYKTARLRYGQKVALIAPADVEAVVKRTAKTQTTVQHTPVLSPPIKKGDEIGKIIVTEGGKPIATSKLVAASDVERPGFGMMLRFYFNRLVASIS